MRFAVLCLIFGFAACVLTPKDSIASRAGAGLIVLGVLALVIACIGLMIAAFQQAVAL